MQPILISMKDLCYPQLGYNGKVDSCLKAEEVGHGHVTYMRRQICMEVYNTEVYVFSLEGSAVRDGGEATLPALQLEAFLA